MPLALLAAFAGSLAIHLSALFGTEIDLSGPPEPLTINAELKPLPNVAPAVPPVVKKPAPRPAPVSTPAPAAPSVETPTLPATDEAAAAQAVSSPEPVAVPAPAEAKGAPVLAAQGLIRYSVVKSSLGMTIGRAEYQWSFAEDGTYRLRAVTETTGLAALLRSTRLEQESQGKLLPAGLQPASYRVLKNGRDSNENADFDWSTAQVVLSRDGMAQPLRSGTQDLLSLHFQLAYLGKLAEGAQIPVVTGKRYRSFALDALGDESVDVPAGQFRALHLRVQGDDVTEFWITPEWQQLPVKIRFTDRKGESFEMLATERGTL